MSYNDVIGTIGVSLILLAYFLNTFDIIPEGKLFFAMNTAGALMACYASYLIHYLPFVILEGTWALVSIAGLIRVFVKN